jgi:hypothetical protein
VILNTRNIPAEEYVETKLFALHLHNDEVTHHKLNGHLRDLFTETYPLLNEYDLIKKPIERSTYCKAYHSVFAKEEKIYSFLKKIYTFLKPTKKEEQQDSNKVEQIKLPYKELILDFLFDVYHSNVFDNSPSFNNIKHLLKNVPILQAITHKAEFYFQINIYSNVGIHNFNHNFYTKELITAQNHWLETIQKEGNDNIIKDSNKWFNDVETETGEVFKHKKKKLPNYIKTEENKEEKQHLIIRYNKNYKKGYKETTKKNKKKSSRWLIQRSNILKAWETTFDCNYKCAAAVSIFILVNVLLYVLFGGVETFTAWTVILSYPVVLFLTLFPLLLIIFNWKKSHIDLLMLRLVFLVTGATFFAFEISKYFNESFVKNNWTYLYFNGEHSPNFGLMGLSAIVLIVNVGLLFSNERNSHPNLKGRSSNLIFKNKIYLKKTGVLIVVILLIAFVTNTLLLNTFYFRKELFVENFLIDKIWTEAMDKTIDKKEDNDGLEYHFASINNSIDNTLNSLVLKTENPMYNQEREHLFNEYLTNIKVRYTNGAELYSLVKEHEIMFGWKIKTVPSVLYINILITLFLVVFMQIVINRKKVVEGGHFE